MKIISLLALLSLSVNAFAADGKGNGGDPNELRFQEIRDDITKWIGSGVARELVLPVGITLGAYETKMTELLDQKGTVVEFTDQVISVGSVEKACENFFDSTKVAHIRCNNARFRAATESDQYKLVHHEYAGLAGFEVNAGGSASDYRISGQITDYLEATTVLRLAVKKQVRKASPFAKVYGGGCLSQLPNRKYGGDGALLVGFLGAPAVGGAAYGIVATTPVGLGAAGVYVLATATVTVVHNARINKVLDLINEAEAYVKSEGSNIPGRTLVKMYKKVRAETRDTHPRLKIMDLAKYIHESNEAGALCPGGTFKSFRYIREGLIATDF